MTILETEYDDLKDRVQELEEENEKLKIKQEKLLRMIDFTNF